MQAHVDIGQAKDPLASAFSLCIKELTWRYLVRFTPSKTPIFLYASRRSGSSLLMQVMAINRGVMFSDQPFGLYTASPANINRLPIFPYGQLACLDSEEERLLYSYIDGLLTGRIRANNPWKLWSREFSFHNDRICLKITDAKAMIEWIDDQFEVQTVVSTRHPVSQALSVSANRWLTTGKGFLRNARFVERWLTDDLEAFCWDIYRSGAELEKRIADWSLENLPLLSLLPEKHHWLYVSYEDLLAHPSAAVQHLSEQLDLADVQGMIAQLGRPSRSTKRESTKETRRLIKQQQRQRLLDAWQEKISGAELSSCFRVLDRFGIDLYRPDSAMPHHQVVGRTSFAEESETTQGSFK